MPIYEYRCSQCGHELEALQKLADAPLVACPACHAQALVKQMSAAGFQLKGSGWYATDFRGGKTKPAEAPEGTKAEAKSDAGSTSDGESESKPKAKPASEKPAGDAPSTSKGETKAASAGGGGASCAKH